MFLTFRISFFSIFFSFLFIVVFFKARSLRKHFVYALIVSFCYFLGGDLISLLHVYNDFSVYRCFPEAGFNYFLYYSFQLLEVLSAPFDHIFRR